MHSLYRKQQKLSRKMFRGLIGFVKKFRKLLRFCFYDYINGAMSMSISRENFHDSSKIHENCESFLLLNFCCLQYAYIMNKLLAIDCGNASPAPHTSNKIFPLLILATSLLNQQQWFNLVVAASCNLKLCLIMLLNMHTA